ncbi:MAG TPA: matrixin family metalloprotease [Patescibacteria group bacterium]|nr:matrixin family metalloprotease [Patescibacteria group bacterium]
MNRILKIFSICFLALVLLSVPLSLASAAKKKKVIVTPSNPCTTVSSVTYKVGSVDPQFGMSQEKFASMVRTAARAWNTAAGAQVLVEDNTSMLSVNMKYGENQVALNNYFTSLNSVVLAQNRTTPSEYARSASGVNPATKQATLLTNIKLGQYLEKRSKGKLVGKEINVLAYMSDTDLQSTLLHELGHAIGLDHTKTYGAIMSAQTGSLENQPSTLKAADIKLLKNYCTNKI